MGLDSLIQEGWRDHPKHTAEVAQRLREGLDLVETAEGASRYMHLVNHVLGDHLGRRDEAQSLCEAALQRIGDEPGTGPFVHLAVARTLAGDEPGARAALDQLGDDEAQRVRVGLMVAVGHANAGDWAQAEHMFDAQMEAAAGLPDGHSAERSFAIAANNLATEAMGRADRTPAVDALMERAAHVSRTYWVKAGTWVNAERADYLLALVHNVLGRSTEARGFADRALATIAAADGEERVDEAFIHLARAAACRDEGDAEAHAASLARADELAAAFESDGLKSWFAEERAKAT